MTDRLLKQQDLEQLEAALAKAEGREGVEADA